MSTIFHSDECDKLVILLFDIKQNTKPTTSVDHGDTEMVSLKPSSLLLSVKLRTEALV